MPDILGQIAGVICHFVQAHGFIAGSCYHLNFDDWVIEVLTGDGSRQLVYIRLREAYIDLKLTQAESARINGYHFSEDRQYKHLGRTQARLEYAHPAMLDQLLELITNQQAILDTRPQTHAL